ncbi:hypothetical protein GRI97_08920 [Altererythrobacter xixiisoli]|uniref:Uncharacterized protein n=1 Tax=Croceibacterium xixiisoli TaxID=1476466 RepID=A0A6I4TV61_9SPHN|nr:hypothetical protein [Croceibacterium xixiisoli]MXO99109.1 hypothetical protein [Croceibacterium xixiisoli]
MTSAALPRSRLHLQFLIDNGADPDIVLLRDEMMRAPVAEAFPGRGVHLGRETLAGKALWRWPGVHRANRGYYRQVGERMADLGITRLTIFLEGEPLERYLCSLPQINHLELWEDGLSHYVDLTSDHWYAARGLVQAAMGFYPAGITRRRMNRAQALVRDRFEQRNLVLVAPAEPQSWRDELLLVGSPLVEDRIVPRERFLAGLAAIRAAVPLDIRYLPHPREDLARLAGDLVAAGITLEDNAGGLLDHAARWGYRGYAAAVSTGLLDMGRYDRSIFMPALFGLDRMDRVLRNWPALPLPLAGDAAALGRAVAQLPPLG